MLVANDLAGLLPALVTPFDARNNVDEKALRRLIDRMFDGGAKGIVPLGGTGEYTALSPAERLRVAEISVDAAKGRGPVLAGVLSPGYAESLAAAQDFKAAGVDAVMLLTPFYAMGTQQGIADYIRRFRAEVDLPVVLYEIPSRTNISLEPETIAELSHDGTAVGIKFSNYDVPRFSRLLSMVAADFILLSGEEPLVATHIQMGARGAVLATANLFPRYWSELFNIASRDSDAALQHQLAFQPVLDAVFAEANPGPLKRGIEMLGEQSGSVRLPLIAPSEATEQQLMAALEPMREKWGDLQHG